jgi:MscS family membrane protein
MNRSCHGTIAATMNRKTLLPRTFRGLFLVPLVVGICPGAYAQNVPAAEDPPTVAPNGIVAGQTDRVGEDKSADTPRAPLDLSNPRAAMRSFLVAMQDAEADHPERIDDAVRCLDTTGLEGDDRQERARALARRLYKIVDRIKAQGVNLEDIPEATDIPEHVFHQLEPEDEQSLAPEITLMPDAETGQWRFTPFTLESIPKLEAVVEEAAEQVHPETNDVPVARRSPRAVMATFLDAMNTVPKDWEEAINCLDPTGQNPDAWDIRGEDLATKLKNVMDKVKYVVLVDIPDKTDGPPYDWYTSGAGNIVIGRVEQVQPDDRWGLKVGEWRFTPQTLKTLDQLYEQFEGKEIVAELQEAGVTEDLSWGLRLQRWMPEPLRGEWFSLKGWQWLALVVLLLLGWPIKIIAAGIVSFVFWALFRRTRIAVDREIQRRALRSSGVVVTLLVWFYAVPLLLLPDGLLGVLVPVLRFGLIGTIIWASYRLVDVLGGYIVSDRDVQLTEFDDVLIPLLRTILRVLVVIVVILFACDRMGWQPTAVFGALGIGGVAVAFAAKETISNFFGSLTVLLDRPFSIGDWICMGDVDGTVERVGFRSTRVRTFYNSVITVPNAQMVNTQVDNYGARRYRRARTMLSIAYSTPPERIDAFCEGIRELIRLHPFTRKDYYHVYFNKFAASSLDILLYVFFDAPDWSTELRERHHLFIDILRLAKRLDVEFAFPTQTVWLERARAEAAERERLTIAPGKEDPNEVGLSAAAKVFTESYGEEPVGRGRVVIDTAPRSKRARKSTSDGGK